MCRGFCRADVTSFGVRAVAFSHCLCATSLCGRPSDGPPEIAGFRWRAAGGEEVGRGAPIGERGPERGALIAAGSDAHMDDRLSNTAAADLVGKAGRMGRRHGLEEVEEVEEVEDDEDAEDQVDEEGGVFGGGSGEVVEYPSGAGW